MTATWAAISMSSRLRLFTIPATIAGTGPQVRLHLGTKAPGPTWSATPSDDYEPWRSGGRALPTCPPNPARPGHLEPVPTRDDTRATVSPEAKVTPGHSHTRGHNQTWTAITTGRRACSRNDA